MRLLIEEFLRVSKSRAEGPSSFSLAEEGVLPVASSFPLVDAWELAIEMISLSAGETALNLRLLLTSSSDMVASTFTMAIR